MKKKKNIVDEAVKAFRNESTGEGPSEELLDAIIQKGSEAGDRPLSVNVEAGTGLRRFAKMAVAAVLLIATAFVAGRFTSTRSLSAEEIQSLETSLEPAIRENLLKDIRDSWQMVLANSHTQLRDELSQQYRRDLEEVGMETLITSNAITNQLLSELIDAINAEQGQDHQLVVAALGQMELSQLQDTRYLQESLGALAKCICGTDQ